MTKIAERCAKKAPESEKPLITANTMAIPKAPPIL